MFDGKQYQVNVLIYATGFEVQKTGIYNRMTGINGLELNDKYREGVRSLVGFNPRAIRTSSSWAACRLPSSSTTLI